MSPTQPPHPTPEALHTQHLHLSLDGKSAEVAYHSLPSAHGTILLLHEALGSVSYWKQFPHKLAVATHYNVIAYSRAGHGNSEGPLAKRTDDYYLHQVNTVIPALLDHFSVADPVLYGHSEGAGISLLYAAQRHPHPRPHSRKPLRRLHQRRRGAHQQDGRRLSRQQAPGTPRPLPPASRRSLRLLDPMGRHPRRRSLPPPRLSPKITCPVLVLQGARDEFGTSLQLAALQAAIPNLQHETYPDTGHLPHKEQTDRVLHRVSQFLSNLTSTNQHPHTRGGN